MGKMPSMWGVAGHQAKDCRGRQQQTHTDRRYMFHSTFLSTLRHCDDCPPVHRQVNLYGPENDGDDRGGM